MNALTDLFFFFTEKIEETSFDYTLEKTSFEKVAEIMKRLYLKFADEAMSSSLL